MNRKNTNVLNPLFQSNIDLRLEYGDGCVQNVTFNIYDPSGSITYKRVECDSPYCALPGQCTVGATQCPYRLQYLSPASTEGYLVEDVMYLVQQKGGKKTATDIVFGYLNLSWH